MANGSNVILHAFNWTYREIINAADNIRDFGYRFVLVSPPAFSEGGAWWARYQPKDYRILLSPLGNKRDFTQMIEALEEKGIDVIVDVILNHMANEQRADRLDFPGQDALNRYRNDPVYEQNKIYGDLRNNLFSPLDFNPASCIRDWEDLDEVRLGRLCNNDEGLPDLKSNDWVITQQHAYLSKLKELGACGFRLDAAKQLPLHHLNGVVTDSLKAGMFIFGEVIDHNLFTKPHFLRDYINETDHCAYDFPLHNTIVAAFRPGGSLKWLVNPAIHGSALPTERSVSFVITHDIPNNSMFRGLIMDRVDEHLAYAYILGKDGGVPMVYSDKGEADGLYKDYWKDAYRRHDIVNMIGFHNRVHGTTMQFMDEGDCFLLLRREHKGVVGINKCAHEIRTVRNTDGLWWHRNYRDVLTGDSFSINSHQHEFVIPPRTARLWLLE